MSVALRHKPRVFNLHLRCSNCLRESERRIDVPAVDDAPEDIDELIESGLLGEMRFHCMDCQCLVGNIIGIGQEKNYDL